MSFLTDFKTFLRADEPLAPHTWFGLGGSAEYLAEPETVDQLAALVRRCKEDQMPVRMLGGGSNILVRDEGVPGVVIKLSGDEFSKIVVSESQVTAGGGAKLGHVISTAIREGLAGLETLVGIPGTMGGALHGNAGSHGGDVGQRTAKATVMTRSGELVERTREEMVFAYRQSSLDELVIVEAQFDLESDDPVALTKRMQKHWIVKKASQPMSHQSAGCVFKNPRGMSAAMLIEQAGLKGTQIGQAMVSDRHANFIIADEGASSDDVRRLIELVQSRVQERLGVELETEIEIW
ncbi:MAG: UDP-N-acetylmuramate dehydrogenase [Planctomycetes bacterium]|nr:UDP-N-acetylmuramate dehydrogenase [Planctomycetota bacterium]